jgi:hypothetical protein
MTDIDAGYLRRLGNLPVDVSDELLLPHIRGGVSTAIAALNGRVPATDLEMERVREAMGCFAMANALPVLNTFYLSQAEKVPRHVATTDYVFHEPGDLLKLAASWRNRGYEVLRGVGRTTGAVGITVI